MFSAIKKLANRNDLPVAQNGTGGGGGGGGAGAGVQSMATNLQKKFAKVCLNLLTSIQVMWVPDIKYS